LSRQQYDKKNIVFLWILGESCFFDAIFWRVKIDFGGKDVFFRGEKKINRTETQSIEMDKKKKTRNGVL
jgi:hypothetical protein